MTPADYIGFASTVVIPMAGGFIWLGRKLEADKTLKRDVEELRKAKLPERVLVLESIAGVK